MEDYENFPVPRTYLRCLTLSGDHRMAEAGSQGCATTLSGSPGFPSFASHVTRHSIKAATCQRPHPGDCMGMSPVQATSLG